tara:strand:+ start:6628 stop:8427 length:1800 start_codon:yes stop_codon:yes gene_type:complete
MYTYDKTKTSRLQNAIEYSRRQLLPYREKRLHAIRQFVGTHYTDAGAQERVPLNLLEMAVSIYRRQIAARRPNVLVTSKNPEHKAVAGQFEFAMNSLLKDIDFEDTVQKWVLDAMFGIGIVKTGLTASGIDMNGYEHDPGQPFVDNVDFDDFVFDMSAKRWDQMQFCGNRYSLPLEAIKQSKMFGKKTEELTPSEFRQNNEFGEERIQRIGSSEGHYGDQHYSPIVELWDIWLPLEGVVVTMQADDRGGVSQTEPLRVVEWEGPEEGPYYTLGFGSVPGNLMPLPPVSLLLDLHEMANRVFRKLGRQADRQKTVTLVQSGQEDDGRRIAESSDGDIIRTDRPEATREARYGGVDQPTLAYMVQLKDLFVYMGGNLDALGGLGKLSETVGQEQLIAKSASARIADMQESATKAVKKVVNTLGKYLWYDPVASPTVLTKIPDTNFEASVEFTPEIREGEIIEYEIDIAPYSMVDRSPSEKAKTLGELMQGFIIPLAPLLQQQGMKPDMNKFLELMAKYSNTDELMDIITKFDDQEISQMKQMQEVSGGGQERPKQSPVTTRKTVRENIPGSTRQGRDEAMMQLLSGGGQPAQAGQMAEGMS